MNLGVQIYNTDILIIGAGAAGCYSALTLHENPNEVEYPKEFKICMPNYIWVGDNKNKGLAVFSKHKLKDNLWDSGGNKYFISCRVSDGFHILGVWCHYANSPTFGYIGQMWKYLKLNKDNIRDKDIIIGGDFNSNKIWDVWDRWWNHSDVFNELKELGIKSLYHLYYNEEQGKETIPTLYHKKIQRSLTMLIIY
jgi:hypothetical protein